MHRTRKIFCGLLAAALVFALTGCRIFSGVQQPKVERPALASPERQFAAPAAGDTVAVFETSKGTFRAVLYPEAAPQACANFTRLVQQGYYNGLAFSRVEAGFIVQAGVGADGAGATAWGGSGYPAEYSDTLHHYSGALCMALDNRQQASSVFYVVETLPDSVDEELAAQMAAQSWRQEVIDVYRAGGGAPYLDYTDTVFGQVYEGMDVIDAIAQCAVDEAGKPVEEITIQSVTILAYEG